MSSTGQRKACLQAAGKAEAEAGPSPPGCLPASHARTSGRPAEACAVRGAPAWNCPLRPQEPGPGAERGFFMLPVMSCSTLVSERSEKRTRLLLLMEK